MLLYCQPDSKSIQVNGKSSVNFNKLWIIKPYKNIFYIAFLQLHQKPDLQPNSLLYICSTILGQSLLHRIGNCKIKKKKNRKPRRSRSCEIKHMESIINNLKPYGMHNLINKKILSHITHKSTNSYLKNPVLFNIFLSGNLSSTLLAYRVGLVFFLSLQQFVFV